ncbi:MFS transporter [Proteus appendicitidis]|uniref:MFS transporter n=1 Tax=Proteus appendicitidis TaxID=3034648 RepID=A0ABY8YCG7_9GAMM|nr:MFS transporter [Proteus sp. HZ0627]WIV90153.1 MFS transporter [Proteus sp. HZ0627]
MISTYQTLFSYKGTASFTLAGMIARLPLPMMGIGIIMMISQITGSYALAGTISASFVFTYAVLSPQISRLVDTYGQSRILPLFTLMSVIGIGGMLLATWLQWHISLLFIFAVLIGFMPCISAMVRARWTAIYKEDDHLQTAYSLESVFDEVTFILGPPISVTLSVAFFPQAGLLMAAIFLIIGVLLLVSQRNTEPAIKSISSELTLYKTQSVIRFSLVKILTVIMIFMGAIVGTIDIFSVAFANIQGAPIGASLVLSAYAIGSCFAGLFYGTLKLSTPLHRLLCLGGIATFLTILPLVFVGSIYSLSFVVLISGVFFAPMIIVTMSLIEKIVPENQLTEGMTWLLAGLNVGTAVGAILTGQLIDYSGVQAGVWIAIGASALVMLIAFIGFKRINNYNNKI